MLASTKAVLFFSTPHRGVDASAISDFSMRFASVLGLTNRHLLDYLSRESLDLQNLLQSFAPISQSFDIFTFYETVRTKFLKINISSYYMGLPNERLISINKDFRSITRFGSQNDPEYRKVASILRSLAARFRMTPNVNDWTSKQLLELGGKERLD